MVKKENTEADPLLAPNDGVDLGPEDLKDTIEAMTKSIKVAPKYILEIGPGAGRITIEVRKAYPLATIDVYDRNAKYIKMIKNQQEELNINKYFKADIKNIADKLAGRKYDLIIACGVM